MPDRDAADISRPIQIEQGIFIQVFGIDDFGCTQFDMKGIGILKGFDIHNLKDLSKKSIVGDSTIRQ
jgi:hypothetical protein